jgi:hypothetical protein
LFSLEGDRMAGKSIPTGMLKQSTTDIAEESVRIAAYYIWEKEGRPDGEDLRHWYLAIAELSPNGSSAPMHAAKKTNTAKRKKISATRPKSNTTISPR